MIVIMWS